MDGLELLRIAIWALLATAAWLPLAWVTVKVLELNGEFGKWRF